jgi:formylglycine-generating enzyme
MRLRLFLPGVVISASVLTAGMAQANDDLVLDLGGTTLETRYVVHGVFTQGAAANEPVHDKDEEPAHQVTISHDFWMGKFPVTKGQFAKFVSDTRYVTDAEKNQSGGMG